LAIGPVDNWVKLEIGEAFGGRATVRPHGAVRANAVAPLSVGLAFVVAGSFGAVSLVALTGLDDRHRDRNGEIRHKNGTTLVRTLRETYGENFAPNVRSDMKLDTLLDRTGGAVAKRTCEKALTVSCA
jgi:hypothetical protein